MKMGCGVVLFSVALSTCPALVTGANGTGRVRREGQSPKLGIGLGWWGVRGQLQSHVGGLLVRAHT